MEEAFSSRIVSARRKGWFGETVGGFFRSSLLIAEKSGQEKKKTCGNDGGNPGVQRQRWTEARQTASQKCECEKERDAVATGRVKQQGRDSLGGQGQLADGISS